MRRDEVIAHHAAPDAPSSQPISDILSEAPGKMVQVQTIERTPAQLFNPPQPSPAPPFQRPSVWRKDPQSDLRSKVGSAAPNGGPKGEQLEGEA